MRPQDTKCTPQPKQESIFRTVFAGWLRFGGIFRRSFRATTKKGQLFGQKSAPQTKSWLRLWKQTPDRSFSNRHCISRAYAISQVSSLHCSRTQTMTLNSLTVFTQINFLVEFLQSKCDFNRHAAVSAFSNPPLRRLGTTYDVHLGLIGKRVVDFLLVLIELFSLGVTVEVLRAKID